MTETHTGDIYERLEPGPPVHWTHWGQCDDCDFATALTLEALRAVERYGATQSGEHVGYRQIAAPSPPDMDHETARSILVGFGPLDPESLQSTLRRARRRTHPDSPTGSREQWGLVEQAARVLGVES